AGEGADLTDPEVWSKLNYPIQHSGMYNGRWQLGTGHGMWSQDEDGNLLYVFHARTDHNGLSGRDTFVRRVHFAADGLPVLDMELEEEVAPANSTVTARVTVTPADEPTTTVLSRCVAGDVVLLTRTHNPAHAPVTVELGTPVGGVSNEIAPGRTNSRAFNTRTPAAPTRLLRIEPTHVHSRPARGRSLLPRSRSPAVAGRGQLRAPAPAAWPARRRLANVMGTEICPAAGPVRQPVRCTGNP